MAISRQGVFYATISRHLLGNSFRCFSGDCQYALPLRHDYPIEATDAEWRPLCAINLLQKSMRADLRLGSPHTFLQLSPRPGAPQDPRPPCIQAPLCAPPVRLCRHANISALSREWRWPGPEKLPSPAPGLNIAATPGPGGGRPDRASGYTDTLWPKRHSPMKTARPSPAVRSGPAGGRRPWRRDNLRTFRGNVCAKRLIDANNYETQNCAIPDRTTPVRHV